MTIEIDETEARLLLALLASAPFASATEEARTRLTTKLAIALGLDVRPIGERAPKPPHKAPLFHLTYREVKVAARKMAIATAAAEDHERDLETWLHHAIRALGGEVWYDPSEGDPKNGIVPELPPR